MEVAVIDWKSLDSRFVKDELYEHINAPKWMDFSAQEDPVDDEAWFCRPNCNHPKTVEDFFNQNERTPTSSSKLKKTASVSPFGDRNKREATLKKRGVANQPLGLANQDTKCHRIVEDGENQDPNFSTPLNHKAKTGKEAFKSSAEKKVFHDDNMIGKEQTPKLRSTLSARNLFSGGDFLSKVTEFCNELKKLAVRTKDKENTENVEMQAQMDEDPGVLSDKEKERKPLLEVGKEKSEVMEKSASKGLRQKKIKNDDMENTPVSLDVKKIKQREAENGLLGIRTCPPTPQCFSAGGHGPPKDSMPSKHFRHKPLNQERGILQELKQANKEAGSTNRVRGDNEKAAIIHGGGGEVAAAAKEAKALDVFWFLKPCTTLSS